MSSSHFLSSSTATWPTCQLKYSTCLASWRKSGDGSTRHTLTPKRITQVGLLPTHKVVHNQTWRWSSFPLKLLKYSHISLAATTTLHYVYTVCTTLCIYRYCTVCTTCVWFCISSMLYHNVTTVIKKRQVKHWLENELLIFIFHIYLQEDSDLKINQMVAVHNLFRYCRCGSHMLDLQFNSIYIRILWVTGESLGFFLQRLRVKIQQNCISVVHGGRRHTLYPVVSWINLIQCRTNGAWIYWPLNSFLRRRFISSSSTEQSVSCLTLLIVLTGSSDVLSLLSVSRPVDMCLEDTPFWWQWLTYCISHQNLDFFLLKSFRMWISFITAVVHFGHLNICMSVDWNRKVNTWWWWLGKLVVRPFLINYIYLHLPKCTFT